MKTIFLLEPNQVLARQYQTFLSDAGYTVVHLVDAQDAIVAADKKRPDLIILELLLAGHSGVEFLYELRSYNEWQAIPVVILSRVPASESGIDEKKQIKMGIVRYLYKPETTLKKLREVIADAV